MFWSVGWPLLWAGGFFCNLDILYGGLGIGKLQFLIKKKFNFCFQLLFFFNFWSLKPWIRIGSGSGSVMASIRILWIRIRIRKKWIRIRNPGRSLQLSKVAIQHLKTWTFKTIFYFFVCNFCPPGSGSRILIHWPDWIQVSILSLAGRYETLFVVLARQAT
jgi:hypothetical protein